MRFNEEEVGAEGEVEEEESTRVQGGRCVHTSGWQARSELRGAFLCLGYEGKINKPERLYKERQGGNWNVEIPKGKSVSHTRTRTWV